MKKYFSLIFAAFMAVTTIGLTAQNAAAAPVRNNLNRSAFNQRSFADRNFNNRAFQRNMMGNRFLRNFDNRRFVRDFDNFRFRNINRFYGNRFFGNNFSYFYPISTGYYYNSSFYPYDYYYNLYNPVNIYGINSTYPYYNALYNQYSFLQSGYDNNITARQIVFIDRDNPTSNFVINNQNASVYAFDRVTVTLDNATYTSMMNLLSAQNTYMTRVDVTTGTVSILTDNGTVIATGSGAVVIQ